MLRCPMIFCMEEFGTFIIASAGQIDDIVNLQVSTEWSLSVRNDPSQRHWSDERGRTSTTLYGAVDSKKLQWLYQAQDHIPSQQIIIRATDIGTASNVNSLVYGGILLGYPDLLDSPEPPGVYSLSEKPEEACTSEDLLPSFKVIGLLPLDVGLRDEHGKNELLFMQSRSISVV
jgi:hypothetical protein